MTNKKKSIGDLWRTPPEVFNTLDKEFNFYADMAADHKNSKCKVFFNEADDSLSFDWADRLNAQYPSDLNKYVWVNPPYSKPMPWVEQAIIAQSKGLGVVMVLNQDTSVSWFTKAIEFLSEVRFVIGDEKETGGYSIGRIAFLDSEGNPGKQNNKPQFVLIFNPFKIGAQVTSYITKKELYGHK